MEGMEGMEIKKTRSYDKFKHFKQNRKLLKSNLKKLILSISKNDLAVPIIVARPNDEGYMLVIDGQHTLEARKQLSKDVYYYILPGPENQEEYRVHCINALRILNETNKAWTFWDFVNFYASEGVKSYIQILQLRRDYPSIVTGIMYSKIYRGNFAWDGDRATGESILKSGRLGVSDYELAQKRCQMIDDYKFIYSYRQQTCKEALLRMIMHPKYDHKYTVERFKYYNELIVHRAYVRDYLLLFSTIHNKGNSKNIAYFDEVLLDQYRRK